MRSSIAILALALLALPARAEKFTEGVKSMPSGGTVLADTGQLFTQGYTVWVLVSADVSVTVEIQHRDAANTGNVWAQRLYLVSGIGPVPIAVGPIYAQADERMRVVTVGAMGLGNVQATVAAE